MSAGTVRRAIQAYLRDAAVDGVDLVYREQPWDPIADDGWDLATDLGHGAAVIVHLESQRESRITMPAAYPGRSFVGQKAVDHSVGLIVLYQYLIPDGLPTGSESDSWVDPLDAILDDLRAAIQADPTLGCASAGPIFQAGQAEGDLEIVRDLPRRTADKVLSWQLIRLTVTEIIEA